MKQSRILRDQGKSTQSISFSLWEPLISNVQITWQSSTSLTKRGVPTLSGKRSWQKRINSIKWSARLEYCWISFHCQTSTWSPKSFLPTFSIRHHCFTNSWRWYSSKVLASIPISMSTLDCAHCFSRSLTTRIITRWTSKSCLLPSVRNNFSRCLIRNVSKGKREGIL